MIKKLLTILTILIIAATMFACIQHDPCRDICGRDKKCYEACRALEPSEGTPIPVPTDVK